MKKQIAVLMAAATAVTTVAPAIANAEVKSQVDVSVAEVNAKIKDALAKTFKDAKNEGIGLGDFEITDDVKDYQKSQYLVVVAFDKEVAGKDLAANGLIKLEGNYAGVVGTAVKEANKYVVVDPAKAATLIEGKIVNDKYGDKTVKVYIVDKGATSDGMARTILTEKTLDARTAAEISAEDKKTKMSIGALATFLKNNIKTDGAPGFVKSLIVDGKIINRDREDFGKPLKISGELTSGTKFEFKVGDKAVDMETVKTGDTELKVAGVTGIQQSAYDKVTGFKFVANDDNKKVIMDVPTGDINVYNVVDVLSSKEIKIDDVYTKGGGYSQEGADFVNKLKNAVNNKTGVFNHEGTSYRAKFYELQDAMKKATISSKDGKFALEFVVPTVDNNDPTRKINLKVVLTGKNADDLQVVKGDLVNKEDVVVGRFKKLTGSNRYATAIKVSKENFEDSKANSVVIVGGGTVIDGLSAAPLAAAVKAPVLLADKNGVSSDTLAEIERACGKLYNKTVYIVGGESSVPASVEAQLAKRFPNVVVRRLSGANRFDTSLKVARKLFGDGYASKRVFAVGGDGAADAMSIAPVAADTKDKRVDPIVVVSKDSVNRETREFIGDNMVRDIYAIGGESTISAQAFKDLKAVKGYTDLVRVSGANRYETNLRILDRFYTADPYSYDKISISGLIVATGANDKLVDAQTASVLAAARRYPIMLAGNKLTDGQKKYLKDNKASLSKIGHVYQVGGAVAADVMKSVVDILGL